MTAPFIMPRNCPACQMMTSPAEPPKPGDHCRCPFCNELLRFDDNLVLELAPEVRLERQGA